MLHTGKRSAAGFVFAMFFANASFAQDQGLEHLASAFQSARQSVGQARTRAVSMQAAPDASPDLESPDAQTLSWLRARIPGLEADSVRVMTLDYAENLMRQAVSRQMTFLQFLTQDLFRGNTIYYAPQDVLAAIDREFVMGSIEFSGTTSEGRPFQLQAFLAGQGRVDYLFNLAQFSYHDPIANTDFMIAAGGHVSGRILGPGDLQVQGFDVYAILGFTDVQRITQTSGTYCQWTTGAGTGGGNVSPIHPR